MSDRRLRGEGTVECRSPGRWRFKCPDGQGGRFVSKAEYPDDTAARAALATFAKKIAAGEIVPTRGMTLGDYYALRFLPRLDRRVEKGTRRSGTRGFYESHWPRLAPLADEPLVAIDVETITRWLIDLSDEVEAPQSYLAVLRAILGQAVRVDFLLKSNPAREVKLERNRDEETEADRAPTPQEIEALLSCEAIPRADRLIIAFALGTGLRPGEWRALELADVHLDAEHPYVLVRTSATPEARTKTGKKRKVPLLTLAQRALREWLALLPTVCKKNPLGLAFPTKNGHMRTEQPFGRRRPLPGERVKSNPSRWADFLRVAGIERDLTPHGLRHGFVTGMLTGSLGDTLPTWAVQLAGGHDRLATTERYMHHREDDLFRAVRDRSPDSPKKKTADVGSALFSGGSDIGGEVVPRGGIEPSETSPRPPMALLQAGSDLPGTVQGPTWAEILAGIVAGRWPTEDEARALAATARAAREDADPVLRAVRRVETTDAWQAGLFDLVQLMAETKAREGARKDEGR
jgi:integrase/recombinase XerC